MAGKITSEKIKEKPLSKEAFEVLQNKKFKKIIILAVVFVFIMVILFFINSLSSIPEEPKSFGEYVIPANQTTNENNSISSWSFLEGEVLGFPVLWWVVGVGGWFIWKRVFGRGGFSEVFD